MVNEVIMVCRLEEILHGPYRMISIIDTLTDGLPTYRFKTRYFNQNLNSSFMSEPIGNLAIINGRLAIEEGETIIVIYTVDILTREKNLTTKTL